MGSDISLTTPDNFTLGAYVAEPAGPPKGAVVVIQEIFGVNSHIREVTDGYAQAGYWAIAPKIFDRIEADIELGYTESDMGTGIELAFQKLDMQQTLADLQVAIDEAGKHGKVGVVGYCFGGLLTWLSSCQLGRRGGGQFLLRGWCCRTTGQYAKVSCDFPLWRTGRAYSNE